MFTQPLLEINMGVGQILTKTMIIHIIKQLTKHFKLPISQQIQNVEKNNLYFPKGNYFYFASVFEKNCKNDSKVSKNYKK